MAFLKENKEAMWIRTIKLAPEYAGNGQKWKAISTWVRAAIIHPWSIRENLRYLVYMVRNLH